MKHNLQPTPNHNDLVLMKNSQHTALSNLSPSEYHLRIRDAILWRRLVQTLMKTSHASSIPLYRNDAHHLEWAAIINTAVEMLLSTFSPTYQLSLSTILCNEFM